MVQESQNMESGVAQMPQASQVTAAVPQQPESTSASNTASSEEKSACEGLQDSNAKAFSVALEKEPPRREPSTTAGACADGSNAWKWEDSWPDEFRLPEEYALPADDSVRYGIPGH